MNDLKVNAMIAELHSTINAQLQRLINMAAEVAELKETIRIKESEIEGMKNEQPDDGTLS